MEQIKIDFNESGFTVRQGDKYVDYMGWDEMMGLIAAMTMPKDFSQNRLYWMRTQEQWEAYNHLLTLKPKE